MRTELTSKYFDELNSRLGHVHDGKSEPPEQAMDLEMASAEEIGSEVVREKEAHPAA